MTTSESDSDVVVGGEDNGNADESRTLDLTIEVDSPSACERHITVTVSRADIDHYYDKAFTEMMPSANVPGFRPGRAPRKLVEGHFRKDVTDQVKGSLLLDSMTQITEGQNFSAISEPDFDFDAVQIPDEGPLVFEFDLEVRPEFDMPKWRGLKLDRPTREFTRQDVDAHLERLLGRHAALEPHEGPAEAGDYVIVDLTAKHHGKVVSKADELQIRVRRTLRFADGTLEDFDKLMIGAKADDKKQATIQVTPDAAVEHLRGENLELEFEVLDVKRLAMPKLDSDLLLELGGFENEGDLRDAVKSDLDRQLTYTQHRGVREQITRLLTESAEWELPPELLRRQSHRELERATMELRSSGFSEEQIQAHANMLRQNSAETTSKALKEHFILERIAEEEDIEATDDDYEQEIASMAMQSQESPRSMRARIEKRGMMDALRNQIIERKAIEMITSEATFGDVPYTPQQETEAAVDHAVAGLDKRAEIPDAKHGGDQRELQQPADRT